MNVASRLAALVTLGGLLAGCIGVRWESDTRFEHISKATCESLAMNESDVDDCLALLGAPLWVWETSEDGRSGAVLAYGWYRGNDRMLRVTVPFTGQARGNFDYHDIDGSLRGLVLFFDDDWKLVRWRRGRMHDITSDISAARRSRPGSVDVE